MSESYVNEEYVIGLEARITELESIMQDAKQVIERQRDERTKLEAENARLREALLTIRDINVFADDIT